MGEIELDIHHQCLIVHSNIITYGNAATTELTEQIRYEIETMLNEPTGKINFKRDLFAVAFNIKAWIYPDLSPLTVYQNTDPRNNYFRMTTFVPAGVNL